MKSSWWFRLYTGPKLLKVIKLFVITFLADLSLTNAFPNNDLVCYVYYLPLLGFASPRFKMNLPFHKLNIPFTHLKNAYVFDSLLTSFLFIFSYCTCFKASYALGGSWKKQVIYYETTPLMALYYMLLVFFFFFSMNFAISHMRKKQQYKMPALKQFFNLGTKIFLVFFVLCLVAFLSYKFHVDNMAIFSLVLSSGLLGFSFFEYQNIFHLRTQSASDLKTFFEQFKFVTISVCLCLGMYFTIGSFGRYDILNKNYSLIQRQNSFYTFGAMGVSIDRNHFTDLVGLGNTEISKLLYKNLEFDPNDMDMAFFISFKTVKKEALLEFLKYGKPTERNLTKIYNKLHNCKGVSLKHDMHLFVTAYSAWPKDKILPASFLAQYDEMNKELKIKSIKRGVATQKN